MPRAESCIRRYRVQCGWRDITSFNFRLQCGMTCLHVIFSNFAGFLASKPHFTEFFLPSHCKEQEKRNRLMCHMTNFWIKYWQNISSKRAAILSVCCVRIDFLIPWSQWNFQISLCLLTFGKKMFWWAFSLIVEKAERIMLSQSIRRAQLTNLHPKDEEKMAHSKLCVVPYPSKTTINRWVVLITQMLWSIHLTVLAAQWIGLQSLDYTCYSVFCSILSLHTKTLWWKTSNARISMTIKWSRLMTFSQNQGEVASHFQPERTKSTCVETSGTMGNQFTGDASCVFQTASEKRPRFTVVVAEMPLICVEIVFLFIIRNKNNHLDTVVSRVMLWKYSFFSRLCTFFISATQWHKNSIHVSANDFSFWPILGRGGSLLNTHSVRSHASVYVEIAQFCFIIIKCQPSLPHSSG